MRSAMLGVGAQVAVEHVVLDELVIFGNLAGALELCVLEGFSPADMPDAQLTYSIAQGNPAPRRSFLGFSNYSCAIENVNTAIYAGKERVPAASGGFLLPVDLS